MLRVPLSEVRNTEVDHNLTETGDALLILLNPCTEIALESPVKVEDADVSNSQPLEGKRRKLNPEENTKKVVYRISSHCLAQASSYFSSIFNDTEDGATQNNEFGLSHALSHEWDPAALLLILQIVHFKFDKIPAKVPDVYFLGKLVVIADYVKCLHLLKPFTEKWLDCLGGPWKLTNPSLSLPSVLPIHFCVITTVRESTIWAYASWRLSLDKYFKQAAISLLFNAEKPIDDLGLPLDPHIISKLNDEREERLQRFFGEMENTISNLTCIKDDQGLEKEARLLCLGLLTDIAYKDQKCRCQAKRPYHGESLKENLVSFWTNSLDSQGAMESYRML